MRVYPEAVVPGVDVRPDAAGDIGDGCQIHADCRLGDGVHIAPNVTVVGKYPVTLGDGVTLSPGVVVYSSRPDVDRRGRNSYRPGHRPVGGPVELGADVYVGANAVIGPASIAEGVVIAAGSYVEADIAEPWTLWAGRPAEYVRDCEVAR